MTVISRIPYTSMTSPKTDARNAQVRIQAHEVLDRRLDELLGRAAKATATVKVDVDGNCLLRVRSAEEETHG